MTRYQHRTARRLYTEGYGINWAVYHSGLTREQFNRALQLRYQEQGPVKTFLYA